jgi:hypothetical protein
MLLIMKKWQTLLKFTGFFSRKNTLKNLLPIHSLELAFRVLDI